MSGLGVGQLFFGSLSDHTGRKRPVLVSLLLYVLVTVGLSLLALFVCLCFMQGVASSGGVVIARSIVADCYRGTELSRMYGVVGMINGVATVLAPVFGGLLAMQWGWRGVFWFLLAVGVMMMPCAMCFRETLSAENRVSVAPRVLAKNMAGLLRSSGFLVPCLCYAMLMSVIIVNLSSAPFIMDAMGLDESGISLALGVNAIVLAIVAMISSRFKDQRAVLWWSAVAVVLGAARRHTRCGRNHLSRSTKVVCCSCILVLAALTRSPSRCLWTQGAPMPARPRLCSAHWAISLAASPLCSKAWPTRMQALRGCSCRSPSPRSALQG